jgi:hypothetical protein
MTWKLAESGGKKYTIQVSTFSYTIRKNDGFTWTTGTKLGTANSLTDAISLIKSDSGSSRVNIRDS